MWSPCGVHVESSEVQLSSNKKKKVHMESMWSPCGVVESTRTLWGRVKYTGKAGVVAVAEHAVVPASANSEAGELYVVFENMLIIVHFQIVDAFFCLRGGIDGA